MAVWGDNTYGQFGNGRSGDGTPVSDLPDLAVQHLTDIGSVAGRTSAVAVRSDGTVLGWGWNTYGQVGNGQVFENGDGPEVVPVPTPVAGVSTATAAAHTGNTAAVLLADGTVAAWGNRNALGSGQIAHRATAAPVAGLANITQLTTGPSGFLALDSSGGVWQWGSTVSKLILPRPAVHIGGGGYTGYAVLDNGELYQWGLLLRSPATGAPLQGSPTPVPVAGLAPVEKVFAAEQYTLAVTQDGQVLSWGRNDFGQLGQGHFTGEEGYGGTAGAAAVLLPSAPVALSAGDAHALVLLADGQVYSWGNGQSGQLGQQYLFTAPTPVRVHSQLAGALAVTERKRAALPNGDIVRIRGYGNTTVTHNVSGVVDLTEGRDHIIALTADGEVLTWGELYNGEGAQRPELDSPTPVLDSAVAVATGADHTLALREDGTVWSWGRNNRGQLGLGHFDQLADPLTPTQIPGLDDVVAIDAGEEFSAALLADGTLHMWGDNRDGQLGNGAITPDNGTQFGAGNPTPGAVTGSPSGGFTALGAGRWHMLAVAHDGTVWSWGDNWRGALGGTHRDVVAEAQPGQVPGLAGVTAVSARNATSYAVLGDGTAAAWGNNLEGQLGIGYAGVAAVPSPAPIVGLTGVLRIDPTFDGGYGIHNVPQPAAVDPTKEAQGEFGSDGGTVTTATPAGPNAADPLQVTVSSVSAGGVSIVESTTATTTPPSGYTLGGHEVSISAPTATASNPLRLTFALDASLLSAGQNAATVTILRNGVVVPDCSTGDGSAAPDPCVVDRTATASGASLTILTSAASTWNFGWSSNQTAAHLSAALAAPASSTVGSKATYTATIRNAGPATATGVTATFVLPSTAKTSFPKSCTRRTSGVICTVGTLAVGNTATISLTTVSTAAGTARATMQVGATSVDPNPSNNFATAVTEVAAR